MTRTMLVGLAFAATALGGCASAFTARETPPTTDGMAAPATTAPLPPNAFAPSPNHYFGTGGP